MAVLHFRENEGCVVAIVRFLFPFPILVSSSTDLEHSELKIDFSQLTTMISCLDIAF
jgi:hypothetical protein